MDEVKGTEQNEHSFIREKIVYKKKSKIKRLFSFGCGVILLAVIFGVVSRFFFVLSEPFVNKMLGVSTTPIPTQPIRNQVTLPSSQGEPSPTPGTPKDKEVTPGASLSENVQGEDKENGDMSGTIQPDETDYNAVVDIDDYVAIHQEISRVATTAAGAMATITVTTERIDWFEQVYEESSTLSGVIVGDNNVELLILTEASPLLEANDVKVAVGGYATEDTILYMWDPHYNLAVIGIDYASIPTQNLEQIDYAVFGESHSLLLGTPVIAIGNPNGYAGSFEIGTVTAMNSYENVVDDRLDLFNTSIPDYENGAGVVINTSGEIIGLITQTFKDGINQNLNTVIGISRMKPVIEKLINGKQMNYFGVATEELTEELHEEADTKIGIYVTEVEPGSPAEQAGIRKGDIIQIVERTPMNSIVALRSLLDECAVSDELQVTMLRKGARAYTEVETVVTVGEKSMPFVDW